MIYDEQTARDIIAQRGLSPGLLRVWRSRGTIPDQQVSGEGRQANGEETDIVSVRIPVSLKARLKPYKNVNKFIVDTISEKLDRLDAIEKATINFEDIE